MKPRILVVLLVGMLPLSVAGTQTVSGTIIEQTTGLPVRGVGVVLRDLEARPRMGALSDSLGRYSMTAPGDGQYRLTFTRAGLSSLEGDLCMAEEWLTATKAN